MSDVRKHLFDEPKTLVNALHGTAFHRGLPTNEALRNVQVAGALLCIIHHGGFAKGEELTSYDHDVLHCIIENGWVYTEVDQDDEITYRFASPLHLWYVLRFVVFSALADILHLLVGSYQSF